MDSSCCVRCVSISFAYNTKRDYFVFNSYAPCVTEYDDDSELKVLECMVSFRKQLIILLIVDLMVPARFAL